MQGKRTLIVGYGKLGQRITDSLSHQHDVTALKRSPINHSDAIAMCFADVTHLAGLKAALNPSGIFDYVIYCLSPSERSEQGYRDTYLTGLRNVMASLAKPTSLKHILFVSSTSVYHQSHGEHVDEQSLCSPKNFSGKILLEAESFLAGLAIPSTSIRFSGIYGGSRSRLIDQVKQALLTKEPLVASPGFTNRIHEDDCVGFICHLVGLLDRDQTIESCYIATDSCPVTQAEVYAYIAERLVLSQVDRTCKKENLKIFVSEEGKSLRRAGSKRCVNKRMLGSGYQLQFESYQEGYFSLLDG